MLKKTIKYSIIVLLIGLLAGIRAFENELFYDPFLDYFKLNFQNLPLPKIDNLKLYLGLGFRYLLNSIISITIIYVFFKDTEIVKFVSLLYFIFFVILIISFYVFLNYFGENNKMILFYIRRFIIQPLFLMLFLPGFYYQQKIK
jgi:exosortase F-associated protein